MGGEPLFLAGPAIGVARREGVVEIAEDAVRRACLAEGLMAITAGENTLRIAPPLVITESDLDFAVTALRNASVKAAKAAAQ